MDYLPLFTKVSNKHCLLVGGGEVAARKLELLTQAHANVTVVSPQINDEIRQKALIHKVTLLQQEFHPALLDEADLVIAATNNSLLNESIYFESTRRKLLVNVVDNPELCSFIMPAIVDRGAITIAIGTGGKAPVLARLLRGKIESMIPAAYGRLASLAEKYRGIVKKSLPTGTARKNFWEDIFEGNTAEKIFNQQDELAEADLKQTLLAHQQNKQLQGEVYIVGAGPGDPDLLTFKALRLMQKADVVVYDRLVSDDILNLVRRDAERIYVGKEKAHHCVPQDQINSLLIKLAKSGKRVCRLKGGDPYIFGRGGEEAQELADQGIDFHVVPGITSAAGASTYCGIPLTHRDYAQSVTFATGHLKNNQVNLDWESLAKKNQTLVIYMGLSGLNIIAKELIHHGLSSSTPVAIVHRATQPQQKIVTGTLSTISQIASDEKIESPSLIVVGEVVALHNQLHPEATVTQPKVVNA
ncbi:siroheme synthase CysG [Pleionea sp. CnH1-48]|uniref:siroheme synthase CysG n=1 Tax=Pleionea sp. CnH1-48 TaxID=2954494 RepID=UPI002096F9A3|nr:siroheme synthase CysG [Pleionea sp. CnH1-48]MCO7226468.1 siroheme synthase CysG [Pleionea sp. CnH1-48]